MNLQYISDSKEETTGVYIPIKEWNELKSKYNGSEAAITSIIPEWQKEIKLKRITDYNKDKSIVLDFDQPMEDIEKESY